jgi:hypothetical protein
MIKRVLLSGLLVALVAVPALAEKPSALDNKSRKIIISRVCKRYTSKQYTDREVINYAQSLVASNVDLTMYQEPYADDEILRSIQQSYSQVNDSINRSIIAKETKSILEAVDRGCQ